MFGDWQGVLGTAARARVHRGDEHAPRRKGYRAGGPDYDDPALLERLAK